MVQDDFRRVRSRESDNGMTDDDLNKEIQRLVKLAKEELTPEQEARLVGELLQKLIPESMDLRDRCGPVADQGPLGSSAAHAAAAAIEFRQNCSRPSRLFAYWTARNLEQKK